MILSFQGAFWGLGGLDLCILIDFDEGVGFGLRKRFQFVEDFEVGFRKNPKLVL